MEKIFDIAIVGLGPAGLKAAQCALKIGLSVVAFEKQRPGGTCLNLGCIPTKAIMHSSELYREILNAQKSGITLTSEPIIDFPAILKRKNNIIEKFNAAIKKDLLSKGAVVIEAKAKIIEKKSGFSIKAEDSNGENLEYFAKKIIISTGSMPYELPGLEFDHKNILSSDDILTIDKLPKNLTIIGSGAIGIEWARIMSNFKVDVTIIEKESKLLPAADIDVSKRLSRMLKISKIKSYTETTLASFKNGIVELSNSQKYPCECILVASGRKRVYPEINFINKTVKLIINKDYTTNFKNLFAIGDIQADKMLAHNANACAVRLMDKISLGSCDLVSDKEIPCVIYGNPEIAYIGVNEQDLEENFREDSSYKIHNISVASLPKSWCDGDIEGFIKIITYKNKIIGAHIISKEASALIMQLAVAMKAGIDIKTLKKVVFAHPTYSEGILEALEDA